MGRMIFLQNVILVIIIILIMNAIVNLLPRHLPLDRRAFFEQGSCLLRLSVKSMMMVFMIIMMTVLMMIMRSMLKMVLMMIMINNDEVCVVSV